MDQGNIIIILVGYALWAIFIENFEAELNEVITLLIVWLLVKQPYDEDF